MNSEPQIHNSEPHTPNGEPSQRGRPWPKGVSGNPNGRRPKGLATVEKLRTALVKDLPEIIAVVVARAKDGDLVAAKTILERVLPPLKAIETPTFLGALDGTLSAQGTTIMQAMAQGIIAPGQAAQLLTALGSQAKLMEVDELARRIAEIERRVGANGHAKS
jgi:hypothetical protein